MEELIIRETAFILIGLEIDLGLLQANLWPILWAVVAVLISRALVVYSIGRWAPWLLGSLPIPWHHVLFWGGVRGAIGLALGLSLPDSVEPWRGTLRVMAFGVVLFTVLIKGMTMRWMLNRLNLLKQPPPERIEFERQQGRLTALRAAWRRLEGLHNDGILSDQAWETMNALYRAQGRQADTDLRTLFAKHEELAQDELRNAQREGLWAQRGALQDLMTTGLISNEVFVELVSDIDRQLQGS